MKREEAEGDAEGETGERGGRRGCALSCKKTPRHPQQRQASDDVLRSSRAVTGVDRTGALALSRGGEATLSHGVTLR